MLRAGLNIGMIALIMFFTLSNTRTLVLSHPEDAIRLYGHTILFHGIFFLAIAVNNHYLVPQLLFRKKKSVYFAAFAFLIVTTTIISSSYLRYLFATYRDSEMGHFTILAIDLQADSSPFLEHYFITFVPTLVFLAGFAIACITRHLYTRNKHLQLRKEEQLKAELSLLKAQVNPHFLFNMMNSIYSLSLNKSDEAPEVILKLSEILRYNLYETAAPFVLLSKELHILQTYLELESIRTERAEKITLRNEVRSGDIMIAPMLILPIVENAFKHGMDSAIAQGFLHLRTYDSATHFMFECSNNYKKKDRASGSSGLGLENLRRRLQLLYPGKHDLKITRTDSTFDVILQIKIK